MNHMWTVARCEFKLQRRSWVFWLAAVGLLAFLLGEVLTGLNITLTTATAEQPVIYLIDGQEVNWTERKLEILSTANLSAHAAWLYADRIGLMSALLIGLLVAFVWERDKRDQMVDLVNVQPLTSWQYVLGKYAGLVLAWGAILLAVTAITVGWTWKLAQQYPYGFVFTDFLAPLAWVTMSLLFGTAFLLAVSLLLRNGVGALLVHFFYWTYNITGMGALSNASLGKFLTYWFFRLDSATPGLLQSRQADINLNRTLYLALTAALLVFTSLAYRRFRQQGRLFPAAGDIPPQDTV